MTQAISALNANTAQYVQSVQAADGLSYADVSTALGGSIFGAGGFGYSTLPFAGLNTTQMLEYQQQLNQNNLTLTRQNIDSNLALSKQNQAASRLTTSSDDSISRQVASLQRQVQGNKQENIMQEYNKLIEAVAQSFEDAGYTDVSEAQVKATAEKMYAQLTGNALVDDIKSHSDSSFKQGWKRVVSFGISTGTSATTNIQQITGENSNNKEEQAAKVAGYAAGVLTLATVARQGFKFLKSPAAKTTWKVLKKIL